MRPCCQTGKLDSSAACLVFLLWMQPVAGADDYRAGREAYAAGQYAEATSIWMPLAMAGDLRAQFALGTLYDEGAGGAPDPRQSAYWYGLAAEQGLPAAQFNLGNAYLHGRGVPQDDALAIHWWSRAAEQGFAPAQYNLGTQYFHGRGVPKDEAEAIHWYRLAASNGHQRARQIVAEIDAAPKPEANPAGTWHGADWLLARAPSDYTLQLAAMSEEHRISRFIEQHRLSGELAVFSFQRDGKRYFVLLKGDYPDRETARRAVGELPPEIRETSAWIRPLAEVQQLLRGDPR